MFCVIVWFKEVVCYLTRLFGIALKKNFLNDWCLAKNAYRRPEPSINQNAAVYCLMEKLNVKYKYKNVNFKMLKKLHLICFSKDFTFGKTNCLSTFKYMCLS